MTRTAPISLILILLGAGAVQAGSGYERAEYGDAAGDAEWSYDGIDYTAGGYDAARSAAEAAPVPGPAAVPATGSVTYAVLPAPPPAAPLPVYAETPERIGAPYVLPQDAGIPADLAGAYVVTTRSAGIDFVALTPDPAAEMRVRLRDLRHRLEIADADGALTGRDYDHLREGIREIRHAFRDMHDNDSVIDSREARLLDGMLQRHEARIARHHLSGRGRHEPI